jgi:diacylglycerol O-acyltransferase
MTALTNLDTSFLHLETPATPMHVGGVLLFAPPARGRMSLARFRQHLAARLQTAPVFRQRLHLPPALLDNPQWIEDADFQLDNHLHKRVLQGPLDLAALEPLCSEFFSTGVRLDRPLWEMVYVETGRKEDGFAILLKVHHAALDGVSAEAVITGLLDSTPQPRELPPDTWRAERPPALASLLRDRIAALGQAPAKTGELLRSAAGLFARRATAVRFWPLPRYFTAPETAFNVPVDSAQRQYHGVTLPLPLVKSIRSGSPGVTVNDVVLAICAGAARRYLSDCATLPQAPLVAMVPVSRRTPAAEGGEAGGNQVSSMLVALATDVADPVRRLQRIHDSARLAKQYNREVPFDALMNLLPVAAPALVLSAFARTGVGHRLPPIFNLTVTNVPGSPVPLYLDGAPLLALRGMAGIYDGMGLTLVVMSYRDELSIGITSTRESLQHPALLVNYLEEAAAELAAAVSTARDAQKRSAARSFAPPSGSMQMKAPRPSSMPYAGRLDELEQTSPSAVNAMSRSQVTRVGLG